ncbi:ankyrin repeat-containing domain protein, partial [Cladorrhinum sp. PSN259]
PSPLFTALFQGCLNLLKLLEQAGADFNAPLWYKSSEDGSLQSASVLRLAVQHNFNVHLVTYLLQSGAHNRRDEAETTTLVELSAKNQNLAVTKLLLSHNFDVNSAAGTHRTALQHAVINGDAATRFDIVQLLLGYGADPDGRSNMIAGSDNDTCLTPLQIAAKAGDLDIVHVLLQYKAKPNRRSPIWYKGVAAHVDAFLSPLQLAISANNLAVIEALLAHGADVNDRACGRTLFDPAVSLLEARQTPLQMAVSNKNAEAVNILLGYSKPAN